MSNRGAGLGHTGYEFSSADPGWDSGASGVVVRPCAPQHCLAPAWHTLYSQVISSALRTFLQAASFCWTQPGLATHAPLHLCVSVSLAAAAWSGEGPSSHCTRPLSGPGVLPWPGEESSLSLASSLAHTPRPKNPCRAKLRHQCWLL